MAGPLQGLRVVDCSRGTAGPRATGVLADYGADVIWVEPPGGDPWREQLSVEYAVFNRGKRSIELDLRGDGRDTLLQLLATADVFVESWRPGVADELGLGYDDLHDRFPELVYCSVSGFGYVGAPTDLPGYEPVVHAVIGSMGEQVGHRDGPIFEGLPFASIGAGYLAVMGTLAALYRRVDDGLGRRVETSLFDGALAYLTMMWGETDKEPASRDQLTTDTYLPGGSTRMITGFFRCADDEYIGVHTGAVGAFGRLMTVLGLDDRIPPSENGMDIGVPLTDQERAVLESEIHGIFLQHPRDEWVDRLLEADVCGIAVLRPTEVFDQPQPEHNEMIVSVADPVIGEVEQVAPPIKLAATPADPSRPAPTPGQHTDEVLAGLSEARERAWVGSGPRDDRPLLDGVKVLDLGAYYAGPCSSRHLADLGADVIKLETTAGDPLRGLKGLFRAAQAGKRSLAIHLKDPELATARQKLLEWADVIHHNMRPGAAERLGFGYEQARAANPSVIYGHAAGWGSDGPYSLRQSFEPMLSGYVGVGFEIAGQFNAPLYPLGNADPGNGLVGAIAMLLTLLHRRRNGEAQYFENPQLNATMTHMAHIVRSKDGEVLNAARLDPLQYGFGALERLYETAHGWLLVVAATDEHITALGKVVGVDILSDPRFATYAARQQHDYELSDLVGSALLAKPTAEWVRDLRAAGVPAAPPAPYANHTFMNDPENHRTRRVVEAEHPVDGKVRQVGRLVRISDAQEAPHRLAPELGQHTDEILSWLGYDEATIAALRARGAAR